MTDTNNAQGMSEKELGEWLSSHEFRQPTVGANAMVESNDLRELFTGMRLVPASQPVPECAEDGFDAWLVSQGVKADSVDGVYEFPPANLARDAWLAALQSRSPALDAEVRAGVSNWISELRNFVDDSNFPANKAPHNTAAVLLKTEVLFFLNKLESRLQSRQPAPPALDQGQQAKAKCVCAIGSPPICTQGFEQALCMKTEYCGNRITRKALCGHSKACHAPVHNTLLVK